MRNYTELLVANYFPEKNHPTLSKQLKNILQKFSISETLRSVMIKLKVGNIKLSIGELPINNIYTPHHNISKETFRVKLCFEEKNEK